MRLQSALQRFAVRRVDAGVAVADLARIDHAVAAAGADAHAGLAGTDRAVDRARGAVGNAGARAASRSELAHVESATHVKSAGQSTSPHGTSPGRMQPASDAAEIARSGTRRTSHDIS